MFQVSNWKLNGLMVDVLLLKQTTQYSPLSSYTRCASTSSYCRWTPTSFSNLMHTPRHPKCLVEVVLHIWCGLMDSSSSSLRAFLCPPSSVPFCSCFVPLSLQFLGEFSGNCLHDYEFESNHECYIQRARCCCFNGASRSLTRKGTWKLKLKLYLDCGLSNRSSPYKLQQQSRVLVSFFILFSKLFIIDKCSTVAQALLIIARLQQPTSAQYRVEIMWARLDQVCMFRSVDLWIDVERDHS